MALTRRFLKALGIEDEKVDQIIEAHSETVDALKEERDGYKADAEKLPEVQGQLEAAKKKLPKDGEETVPKADYDKLKAGFEQYKNDISAKETHAAKEKAFREILKEAGVSEKRIDAIVRVSDIDSVELADDGKAKEAAKLTEKVKEDWSDFIETVMTKGVKTPTPPQNNTSEKDPFLEGFDG